MQFRHNKEDIMKKKSLALVAFLAMGLSLTACGNGGSTKTETKQETSAASEGSEKAEEKTDRGEDGQRQSGSKRNEGRCH